ncbi:TlpA disulfide reductase family protein [Maribacter sp.]|uniref:TlpA family protein disulfide reductase n=1 Tax=Maribacter sp. TaxID=1897614 RepID=UPI003297033D
MKSNPLKIVTGFIVLALNFTACNSPATISGTIEDLEKENTKIYLIQPDDLQHVAASYLGKVIDSAIVNADGSFEFHNPPTTKEPVLLELAVQPNNKAGNYLNTDNPNKANYMPIIWQLDESIHITANYNEFQQSFDIDQPSEVNKALLALRNIKATVYQTYIANRHWNVEEGDELMEKEHAILLYQTSLMEFAERTPHLLPALVALRWTSPENDYERIPEFLVNQCNTWQNIHPDHPWVQQLCKQSEPASLPVLIGDEFPNIEFPLVTGDTVKLKDVLGKKLTVIDLWASWCAPCRIENRKTLVPLWDKYHDNGLQIVAYALESNETAWKTATDRDGADRWLQSSDLQGDDAPFLKQIRVRTIPANFVLDSAGVVIAKNIHGEELIGLVEQSFEE